MLVSETAAILGVPIDNLNLEEAVQSIFSMVEAYEADKRPRQVITVNVDFVVNTLAWKPGRTSHSELLDVYRKADLATPDGMPLVILGRLLGVPMKERFTGSDLIPGLAAEAARRNKSFYLLGGRKGVGALAARSLQKDHPGLIVAGVDDPRVRLDADGARDGDRLIIERINAAKPDILLIAFGNPKQELWFHRNRSRLRVPVSIGVGGSFEFFAGTIQRAPAEMRDAGLEWLFRILQEPHLFKRYLMDFIKLGLMLLPAMICHCHTCLSLRCSGQDNGPRLNEAMGRSRSINLPDSALVVELPAGFAGALVKRVREELQQKLSGSEHVIVDFSRVEHMDGGALGLIARAWRRAGEENKALYATGASPRILRLLRLNRMLDIFGDRWIPSYRGEGYTRS